MKKKYRYALASLFSLAALVLGVLLLDYNDIIVLNAKGLIGIKQRDLLIFSTLLMLIVVIPVFILTFFIVWKYRKDNPKATYNPDWDYNLVAESIWWGVPCLIVFVLAVITWTSSHELDPFKPIDSNKKAVRIQVVALQWKWLFIYPEEKIATINFIQFPEKTPIEFEITADAPMNSFWIPQLGGQIYAMAGMSSKLHLIANEAGTYYGASANLSGRGFAGMNFLAKASSDKEFKEWVRSAKRSSKHLNWNEYNKLVKPTENNKVALYVLDKSDLYKEIIMKFMAPMTEQGKNP